MGAKPVWPPEEDDKLRVLWLQGLPTAEIGRQLKKSKNAIVGRAHRIDLPVRPSPIRREHMSVGPVVTPVLPPPRPFPTVTLAPLPSLEAPEPAPIVVEEVVVPLPPPPPPNKPARLPPAVAPVAPPVAAPVAAPVPAPPRPSLAIVPPTTVFLPRRVGCCSMPMWSNNERTKFNADGSPLLCRKPTLQGSGYCAEHHAATHVKVPRRA